MEKVGFFSLFERLPTPCLETLHCPVLQIAWDWEILTELVPGKIKRNFHPGNLKHPALW